MGWNVSLLAHSKKIMIFIKLAPESLGERLQNPNQGAVCSNSEQTES